MHAHVLDHHNELKEQYFILFHHIFTAWTIIGVRLEHGPNQESNNTLITVNGIQEDDEWALLCSTDRRNCCNDELNLPGSWFLPNGSEISSTTNTQSLHITLGNQTMGLNISPELPSGIYHCEMMDREISLIIVMLAFILKVKVRMLAVVTMAIYSQMANMHMFMN